jgi:hypothetical protein
MFTILINPTLEIQTLEIKTLMDNLLGDTQKKQELTQGCSIILEIEVTLVNADGILWMNLYQSTGEFLTKLTHKFATQVRLCSTLKDHTS